MLSFDRVAVCVRGMGREARRATGSSFDPGSTGIENGRFWEELRRSGAPSIWPNAPLGPAGTPCTHTTLHAHCGSAAIHFPVLER